MVTFEDLDKIVKKFDDEANNLLTKAAFVPSPAGQGPAMVPADPNAMAAQGGVPMDPNAMAAQGGAPMDPNAMAVQGGMPMDPNAMAAQGGVPMDPNAMPMDPNAMPPQGGVPSGAISPELEGVLQTLSSGVANASAAAEQTQASIAQLAARQQETDKLIAELKEAIQGPVPYEGSTKSPQDVEQEG